MTDKKPMKLGSLNLQPIDPEVLAKFKQHMDNVVIPKIKEDTKRQRRNAAIARQKIAFG